MLSSADDERIRAITTELDTLRLGAGSVMKVVVPAVRSLTEFDTVLLYSVSRRDQSWALELWDQEGFSPRTELLLATMLRSSEPSPREPASVSGSKPALYYDPRCPSADQRNRVVEATAWIDRAGPGSWEGSRLCTEVMRPLGRHLDHQPRALICEGPVMLGWFGGIHAGPVTRRQTRLLSALLPAMRRRLSIERRLQIGGRVEAALAVTLDRLGAPGFIVGPRGVIHETNEAADALLGERPSDVPAALQDAIAGRANPLAFELTELRSNGLRDHWLAVLRSDPIAARLTSCVRTAAARWQLTPRQTEVLGLVTRGLANASIAALFGTGERVVELHVTTILDQAGVDSRAALVSRVLTIED